MSDVRLLPPLLSYPHALFTLTNHTLSYRFVDVGRNGALEKGGKLRCGHARAFANRGSGPLDEILHVFYYVFQIDPLLDIPKKFSPSPFR